MKKLLFFVFDGMTDYEITLAMHLLHADAGMDVVMIAYEENAIVGRSGATYIPHMTVGEVDPNDTIGLVICGGWYGDIRDELKELILMLHKENKLLAGICGAGTYILAKVGVLEGRKYTTPLIDWTDKQKSSFGEFNPFDSETFSDAKVVRDGNVITGVGEAFVDFAVEMCDWFQLFTSDEDKKSFSNHMKGICVNV
jgi:putative intracellular protease/amidase